MLKRESFAEYLRRNKLLVLMNIIFLTGFLKLSCDFILCRISVFDNFVYSFISSFISDGMTKFMTAVSCLASGAFLTFSSFAAYVIFSRNNKRSIYGKMIFVNMILSYGLNELLKAVFQRARPDMLRLADAAGFSFPSGHAMESVCFYGILIYFLFKTGRNFFAKIAVSAGLAIIILLIGISRIYLGVHYASDVLAGYCAGAVWLTAFIMAADFFAESG